LKNPKWLKFWINNAQIFYEKRERTFAQKNSVYDVFVGTLFYKSMNQYEYSQSGMFGRVDPKEFLENYFNVKL
jgi:hypothetical protein